MARKAPVRTYIACGEAADKRTLVRIVRTPDAHVELDPSGKKAGRGAYLCLDGACFDKARAKHLLDARLRIKVGPEEYERLGHEFSELVSDAQGRSRDGE